MMRRSLLLVAFVVLSAMAQPARAQFCPGVSPWVFDDVLASDPFCGFITWMADNGITLGCQTIDANHRLYCPNDAVKPNHMLLNEYQKQRKLIESQRAEIAELKRAVEVLLARTSPDGRIAAK